MKRWGRIVFVVGVHLFGFLIEYKKGFIFG